MPRTLGLDDPHPLTAALWGVVQTSCEAAFYSEADWARLRLELWFANRTMAGEQVHANAWSAIQAGFSEMLLSPAVKRRAGIELKRQAADADEAEAVAMVGKYRQQPKSVSCVGDRPHDIRAREL